MRPLLLVAVLTLSACGQGPVAPPAETRLTLASTSQSGLEGTLSAPAALSTGLTTVWLELEELGQPVREATVTLLPLMTMPDKAHACPVVGEVVEVSPGLYRGQLVFQMASGDLGTWTLSAKVAIGTGAARTLSFGAVTVGDSGFARAFTATDGDGTSRFVSSVSFPEGTRVGRTPVTLTLHRMKDLMTFVPVDDVTVTMVPEMPAHGHGSANNVAPTVVAPGRYEGTVNFSMLGEWKTTFTLARQGGTMASFVVDSML